MFPKAPPKQSRTLIVRKSDKKYLAPDNQWVDKPEQAMAFETTSKAVVHRVVNKLYDTNILMYYGHPDFDVILS